MKKHKKPINVLIITVRADFGGGPEHIYRLIKNSSTNVRFFIACPQDYPYWQKYSDIASRTNMFKIPHRKFSLKVLFSLCFKVIKNKIQVIHSHGKGGGIYGRLIAILTLKPCIHTFHGVHIKSRASIKAKLYICLERFLSFFTKNIISVSTSESNIIKAEKIAFPKKITVIENAVEIPIKKVDKKNFNSKVKSITVITRNDYVKNIDLLICIAEHLKKVSEPSEGFKINLIGPGFEETKFPPGLINIMGPHEKPEKMLLESFCFLSTSRREAMPLSVMEAMVCGLPAVVTDVPGHKDLIDHGHSGFLYESGRAEDALEYILKLSSDFSLWRFISNNAREKISRNYNVNKMVKSTLNLYFQI